MGTFYSKSAKRCPSNSELRDTVRKWRIRCPLNCWSPQSPVVGRLHWWIRAAGAHKRFDVRKMPLGLRARKELGHHEVAQNFGWYHFPLLFLFLSIDGGGTNSEQTLGHFFETLLLYRVAWSVCEELRSCHISTRQFYGYCWSSASTSAKSRTCWCQWNSN